MGHRICKLLLLIACLALVASGDDPYGYCGTSASDTFTFLDDAEIPFCFKFKNGKVSDPGTIYQEGAKDTFYYYMGVRVDKYTLIQIQGCMSLYIYINICHRVHIWPCIHIPCTLTLHSEPRGHSRIRQYNSKLADWSRRRSAI